MSLAKNLYSNPKELAITFKMEKVIVTFVVGRRR